MPTSCTTCWRTRSTPSRCWTSSATRATARTWRSLTRPAATWWWGMSRTRASSTTWWARRTPWCTSPRSPTTTTPCGTPGPSCRPTWWGPTPCWRPPGGTGRGSTTCPRTRCSGTWPWGTRSASRRTPRTGRRARTRPPRRRRTTWCARGHAPSGWRSRCPTAPTTTARTSTWRSSSRARSPTCSPGSGPSCTARGRTCGTGSTWRTTPPRCCASWSVRRPGAPT